MRVWPAAVGLLLSTLVLASCSVSPPNGVEAVRGFELERYLGRWYEIARLDHRFERGLSQVTAEYSLREDGGVRVINRGFDEEEQRWDEAEGRAYFVEQEDVGFLKVSFFGPFFGAYVIFELGEDYDYALVSGPDRSYLWFLARTPEVSPALLASAYAQAESLGFDTGALIQVDQSRHQRAPARAGN